MPGQLLAVARNALVESVRQPFYAVWLAFVGGLLILSPYLAAYTFEDDDKLAIDNGLSMLLVGGLVLAAFTAGGVIGREIEDRTALTVISKPLPRPIFVVGKYLGVAGAAALAWWVWSLMLFLAVRQGAFSTSGTPWDLPVLVFGGAALLAATAIALSVNYFLRRPFGSAWARWLAILLPVAAVAVLFFRFDFRPQSPLTDLNVPFLVAMFFTLLATLLLAAVATAASTRLGVVATLAICLVFFAAAVSTDFVLGGPAQGEFATLGEATGEGVGLGEDLVQGTERVQVREGQTWAKIAYALVPNFGPLMLGDALILDTADNVTAAYVLSTIGYTLLLIVAALALAVALFQTREAS